MEAEIGDKIGRLTIIGFDKDLIEKNGQHRKMAIVKWDCGNIKSVRVRIKSLVAKKADRLYSVVV